MAKIETINGMMVLGGKCGCRWCETGAVPTTKNGWKVLRNKQGRTYGRALAKGHKSHGHMRGK